MGTLHSSRLNLVRIIDYSVPPAILLMTGASNYYKIDGLKNMSQS